jgi:hypothetical protein
VIAGERLPVQLATRVLGVSESDYYEWRGRAPSQRAIRHAWLTEQIRQVHADSRGTYGARRIRAELVLGRGVRLGHGAMEMLMRQAGNAYRKLTHHPPMRACGQPSPSTLGLRHNAAGRPHRRPARDILGGAGRHSSASRAAAHPRGPVGHGHVTRPERRRLCAHPASAVITSSRNGPASSPSATQTAASPARIS